MRLHMADIHLYRARLFFREKEYPWESPAADLAAAEKLINDCGYHRRDEELADAKARHSLESMTPENSSPASSGGGPVAIRGFWCRRWWPC